MASFIKKLFVFDMFITLLRDIICTQADAPFFFFKLSPHSYLYQLDIDENIERKNVPLFIFAMFF